MELRGLVMSADTPVAFFDGTRVSPLIPQLAPLCFRAGGDLYSWLAGRAVDRHRTHSRLLKKLLRITETSDRNTVLRAHAASVTDSYWVKLEGEEDLTWERVRFSTDYFARVALVGDAQSFTTQYPSEAFTSPTPELTNIGSFEKCWRLVDGVWTMYKAGTPFAYFAEILTYRLGKLLGLPMAEYHLVDGYVASPDFTQGVFNYEPAENIVGTEEDYAYNYEKLEKLKPGLGREYLDILFMDALVSNPDRHTANYGVLRDRGTGAVISMAPNFDNNLAMLSGATILTTMFKEFLRTAGIVYRIPQLKEEELRELVVSCCPELQVGNRESALRHIWENYNRLKGVI